DIALRRDELAFRRQRERTVAGVGVAAVRHGDVEIAHSLDRQVVWVLGRHQVALFGDAIDGRGAHADADLHAGGDYRAPLGRRGRGSGTGDPGTRRAGA